MRSHHSFLEMPLPFCHMSMDAQRSDGLCRIPYIGSVGNVFHNRVMMPY